MILCNKTCILHSINSKCLSKIFYYINFICRYYSTWGSLFQNQYKKLNKATKKSYKQEYVNTHVSKKAIIQKITKKHYIFVLLSSFIIEQLWNKIIVFYDTFVELFQHCFVIQLLQNSPLCNSTLNIPRTLAKKFPRDRKMSFLMVETIQMSQLQWLKFVHSCPVPKNGASARGKVLEF